MAGLAINIDKCDFCKQKIKFLGHVVSYKQVKVDPERTAAILNYPALSDQIKVDNFWRLAIIATDLS